MTLLEPISAPRLRELRDPDVLPAHTLTDRYSERRSAAGRARIEFARAASRG